MDGYNAAAWLVDRHVSDGSGDRVAIRCNGESLTYADMQAEMFRAQHTLGELGIGEGDRVVLVVNDEPAFPAWFLGALRAGVVPVPISTMLTADDLAGIVADSGARVVVVSEEFAGHLDRITTRRRASSTPSWSAVRATTSTIARPPASPRRPPSRRRSGSTARARPGCRRA